jgi:hypothetical protein
MYLVVVETMREKSDCFTLLERARLREAHSVLNIRERDLGQRSAVFIEAFDGLGRRVCDRADGLRRDFSSCIASKLGATDSRASQGAPGPGLVLVLVRVRRVRAAGWQKAPPLRVSAAGGISVRHKRDGKRSTHSLSSGLGLL